MSSAREALSCSAGPTPLEYVGLRRRFRLRGPDGLGARELVVVAHEYTQPKGRRFLRISGNKLFLVVIEIKVEGIFGVHIYKHHVSVAHGQFTKAQLVTAICHVVDRSHLYGGRRSR